MKKRILITSLLLLTLATGFCTEVTMGLTYDSHQESFPVGADFGLMETFEDRSNLSVSLAYKNAGAYTASILYGRYFYDVILVSGGLNYDIGKAGITPGIALGTGVVFNDIAFTGSFTANINPENIFRPYYYATVEDFIFDTKEAIIDLSFQFSSKMTDEGITQKIGGGFIYTAYQEGAPATIDLICDVLYVTDDGKEIAGIAADGGLGLTVELPAMDIKLKTLFDIMNPELPDSTAMPFSIGISTTFKL